MNENIPLQPGEVIVPINGYEGLYSVTSHGRVWSHRRGKFRKSCLDKDGYPFIFLSVKGKQKFYRNHRLVAIHYIPNISDKPEVNHKDGDKTNCKYDNLEWSTSQENTNHAMVNGLKYKKTSKYYGVQFQEHCKLRPYKAEVRIEGIKITIDRFKTELEAAKAYNNFVIKKDLNRPLNRFPAGWRRS